MVYQWFLVHLPQNWLSVGVEFLRLLNLFVVKGCGKSYFAERANSVLGCTFVNRDRARLYGDSDLRKDLPTEIVHSPLAPLYLPPFL